MAYPTLQWASEELGAPDETHVLDHSHSLIYGRLRVDIEQFPSDWPDQPGEVRVFTSGSDLRLDLEDRGGTYVVTQWRPDPALDGDPVLIGESEPAATFEQAVRLMLRMARQID